MCVQVLNVCVQVLNVCVQVLNVCVQVLNVCVQVLNVCVQVLNVCVQLLNKPADIGCCAVIVFVEKLEFYQHSYTQWRFRVYKHLEDLNSERLKTENAKSLRYNSKMLVYDVRT